MAVLETSLSRWSYATEEVPVEPSDGRPMPELRLIRGFLEPAASTVTGATLAIPADYRQRILSLRRRRNWDGEGALPITAAACRAALAFVEKLLLRKSGLPLPRVSPSVHGAVSLYWRNGEEHLIARLGSADPNRVDLHWEGAPGRYQDLSCDRDGAVDRVLDFHRQRR
jgi:hypothetical protein